MAPAVVFLTAIILLGGSAVDMAMVQNQKQSLQELADNAALSAAREFAIVSDNADLIEAAATSYVNARKSQPGTMAVPDANISTLTVSVDVTAPVKTFFPGPMAKMKNMSASATAQLAGEAGNICLIGLSDGLKRTISLNHHAQLTANKCALYSNSADAQSMYVNLTADIVADRIYLAGGFFGKTTGTLKPPYTDVPPLSDPLAARPAPSFGACDFIDHVVTGAEALSEGVYCGGLTIDGGNADLFSGVYIIKDGPLTVMNGGSLTGDYVGFYLTGSDAKLNFDRDSSVSLSGPKDGELAGLLFFADASNPVSGKAKPGSGLKGGHLIRSDDASRLVGTIYLPDDILVVDGDQPVADLSEYTVVIAKAFVLNNGPNLVLRTDYALSDVPVPDGVGPIDDGTARLVE